MRVSIDEIVRLYKIDLLSAKAISKRLNISCYQIEKALRSKNVAKRSIADAITIHNIQKYGLREFKLKTVLTDKDELLKVAGIMLYWGEGTKRGGKVSLSNSDPKVIRLFLSFLRRICGIAEERLHLSIHFYEDHDIESLSAFWTQETGIPLEQFYKPYLHRRKKGTYRQPSRYGTVSVEYSDKKLHSLILSWMSEYYSLLEHN